MWNGGMHMRIGFIGAGKVGYSLGRYLKEHHISISGYYSRSLQSAMDAADFTGTNFLGFGKQKEFMSNINLTKSNVYIYMTQLTEEFRSKTLNQELQLLCELN